MFHDGAGAQAGLITAGFALPVGIAAAFELVRQSMRVARTLETVPPALRKQR